MILDFLGRLDRRVYCNEKIGKSDTPSTLLSSVSLLELKLVPLPGLSVILVSQGNDD